jgi:hypothetical protein
MIPINNRIFSKKINNKTYFGFDKTIYLVENKNVVSVDENIPDEIKDVMLIEEEKDNIIDNGESYLFVDESGDEFEANKSTKDVIKNGESIKLTESISNKTIRVLTFLLESDSSDIIKDEETGEETINIDGVDETITIDESGEPTIEEEILDTENTEDKESEEAEIQLILDKLEELNSNISKLESIDMNTRDDVQEVYIQEMGKIGILHKRLDELGYEKELTKDNIVEKLLENYNIKQFSNKTTKKVILTESKIGEKVFDYTKNIMKSRLLENLSGDSRIDIDGTEINHSGNDESYVITGDISTVTDDNLMVVNEDELFDTIEKISNDINKEEEEITKEFKTKVLIDFDINSILDDINVSAELNDNCYYKTKCDLYSDNFTNDISSIMSEHSYIILPKNAILKYVEESNSFVDERGHFHDGIHPKYIESFENVDPLDMEVGKLYENCVNGGKLKLVEKITKNTIDPVFLFENSSGKFFDYKKSKIPYIFKKTK